MTKFDILNVDIGKKSRCQLGAARKIGKEKSFHSQSAFKRPSFIFHLKATEKKRLTAARSSADRRQLLNSPRERKKREKTLDRRLYHTIVSFLSG